MYCDYYSIINRTESISEFVDMLVKEINLRSINFNQDWEFDTIFFGTSPSNEDKPLPKPFFILLSITMQHYPLCFLVLKIHP